MIITNPSMEWHTVTNNRLRNEPTKFVLIAHTRIIEYLRKIEPPTGSVYVLSHSEPIGEEYEASFRRLKAWLSVFSMPTYMIHCSGHAYPWDLRDFLERVKPEYLIPIHTAHPEMFSSIKPDETKIILSNKGTPIKFDESGSILF